MLSFVLRLASNLADFYASPLLQLVHVRLVPRHVIVLPQDERAGLCVASVFLGGVHLQEASENSAAPSPHILHTHKSRKKIIITSPDIIIFFRLPLTFQLTQSLYLSLTAVRLASCICRVCRSIRVM